MASLRQQLPEFTRADHAKVAAMKAAIEALVDVDLAYSLSARTPRGTPHVVIINGMIKPEGAPFHPVDTVEHACRQNLILCRTLRNAIQGPAVLWWRAEPILESGYTGAEWDDEAQDFVGGTPSFKVRMRLCFEAL